MEQEDYGSIIKDLVDRLPGATIEVDNYGQLVIYTGLKVEDDELVPMTEEDFEQEV